MQEKKGPKSLWWQKNLGIGSLRRMADRPEQLSNEAVSYRLRVLRHFVAGRNQTKFATDLGIGVNRWNNFERNSPLSKEVAIKLVQRVPGLTLDWLYRGVEDGLPVGLQRELAAVGRDLTSPAARRG